MSFIYYRYLDHSLIDIIRYSLGSRFIYYIANHKERLIKLTILIKGLGLRVVALIVIYFLKIDL